MFKKKRSEFINLKEPKADIKEDADQIARREVESLLEFRRKFGDEAWAEQLGKVIIAQLMLLTFRYTPGTQHVAEVGKRTLAAITPQILELYRHPTLGRKGLIRGIVEELVACNFIPTEAAELDHLQVQDRR